MSKDSVNTITDKSRRNGIFTIIALVMLANPNINIVDVFPDFIGFYLLAKVFEKASCAAPYFEEARVGFIRAMWVSIAKIPAFMIMSVVRSGNTLDNDIVVLLSFVFAILELIVLLPTINHIFTALFYLGQRTSCVALIQNSGISSADSLRSFTSFFVVAKCVFYTLPEISKLTRTENEGSTVITGSRLYPIFLLMAFSLGLVIGIVWLIRIIKYTNRVIKAGNFDRSLDELIIEHGTDNYLKKTVVRTSRRAYIFFIIAAFCSFDLIFDNFNDINLIPNLLMGVFIFIGAYTLRGMLSQNQASLKKKTYISTGIYTIASLAAYIILAIFLISFGYDSLYEIGNKNSHNMYTIVMIFAFIELIAFIIMASIFLKFIKNYIWENFGSQPTDRILRESELTYRRFLYKKAIVMYVLSLLAMTAKFISTVLNSRVIRFATDNRIESSIVIAPFLPWFGIIVGALSVIYILYSIYFFTTLKEESTI